MVSFFACHFISGESIQQSPPQPSEEEGAVGGHDEEMPSLEDERVPEAEGSKDAELPGETGVNDESLLGEDLPPPPPLPIDPAG